MKNKTKEDVVSELIRERQENARLKKELEDHRRVLMTLVMQQCVVEYERHQVEAALKGELEVSHTERSVILRWVKL